MKHFKHTIRMAVKSIINSTNKKKLQDRCNQYCRISMQQLTQKNSTDYQPLSVNIMLSMSTFDTNNQLSSCSRSLAESCCHDDPSTRFSTSGGSPASCTFMPKVFLMSCVHHCVGCHRPSFRSHATITVLFKSL